MKNTDSPGFSVSEQAVLIYNSLSILYALIFISEVKTAGTLLAFHLAIFGIILLSRKLPYTECLRIILPVLIIPLFFSFQHLQIPFMNADDWDPVLIKVDRLLFWGKDPLILFSGVESPVLTGILQFIYSIFYFLPVILVIELLFFRRNSNTRESLKAVRIIVIGFLLSYAGYFFFPALGPRFYFSEHFLTELEGGIVYQIIHNGINDLENINWDAFPSGHTEIAVLSALLAMKINLSIRHLYWVIAVGIIISTIFLRFHYIVDVIAGIALAFFVWKLDLILEQTDNKMLAAK
jgi:membrane-associated phospholipid phosphatase